MGENLFDASALAARMRAAVRPDDLSYRQAAAAAGVSLAGFSRAIHAHPHTSHETVLRLQRWLAGVEGAQAACAA